MIAQGSDEWRMQRLGHVTASRISDVMMKPSAAGYGNYRAQLICERLTGVPTETFTSAAMQHGTDTEPQARAMYELETGLVVEEVGFVAHPTIEGTGASPDGLVGDAGLVEIKCPQPAKHIKNLTGGKIDRNYLLQMQWQMICTGRDWCDFVSFNPNFPTEMQLSIERVDRDDSLCGEIVDAVEAFLSDIAATLETLNQKYTPQKEVA